MSPSNSQPLASDKREEKRLFICSSKQNIEEKEDYKTNCKRLTMRKNRTMAKRKSPGDNLLEGGGKDHKDKDSLPIISSSCNSLRLAVAPQERFAPENVDWIQ